MRKLTGPCDVIGCENKPITRQLCKKHYMRFWRHGHTAGVNADKGTGWITHDGYRRICINYRIWFEHVLFATRALGRELPSQAVVHHMNEDKLDNKTPFNLVVCPDQKYHKLLHKRTDEFKKFGKCLSLG